MTTDSGFWKDVVSRRLSRRRTLIAAGGVAAGSALLAACGGNGNSSSGGGSGNKLSLITAPVDTTKQAKRGGVMKSSLAAEVSALDPHFQSGSALSTIVPLAAGRLTILKAGYQQEPNGEFIGDLAESWELSPDRMQITFKLRPDAAFAPVAPVNGRLMDAQDILYSWQRFARVGAARSDYANSVNPQAPIDTLTAPDAHTIVMKLALPDVTVPALLSAPQSGRFNILPRESEDKYDPRRTIIGTGPYYMSENTPSVRYVFKRNPGYWDKTFPLLDGIEYPFIKEYATASSQLKVGGLYTYPLLRQEEVLQFKEDTPELLLYQTPVTSGGGVNGRYGYRINDKNVFYDERFRQAYSMSIDRDLFLDVIFNVTKFKQEGLEIETRWNSAILADEFEGWWLDPQGKNFGPNAKYYKHDPAEAKKLLAAAGRPNGVEVLSNIAPAGYDSSYPTKIETLEGMARDSGFSFKKTIIDYTTDFQPHYRDGHGDFEGVAYEGGLLTLNTDAVGRLAGIFYSGSGTFIGLNPTGTGVSRGDPVIDDTIHKARLEADAEKRRQLMLELQRHLGKMQYVLRDIGAASAFQLFWPAVKNVGVYRDVRPFFTQWLDPTLKPLA